MGDNAVVRKLIELLSVHITEGKSIEEDLTYSMTKEFFQNMNDVLFAKQLVTIHRWRSSFSFYHSRMQSSPKMYLSYIFYACRQEARINLNIFERFLCVFALILHLRIVMFWKPYVDFPKLIPDIFMSFYESELKRPFEKCGGFRRLVKYINNPKYLASTCFMRNASSNTNPKDSNCDTPALAKQMEKKLSEVKQLSNDFVFEEAEVDRPSVSMAEKIFKDITFEPSSFSGDTDPLVNICEYNKRRIDLLNEKKTILEEQLRNLGVKQNPSELNSDSATNDIVGQMKDISQHKNIIQEVIKYNRLNISDQSNKNNFRQREVYSILDKLEKKIKYFLEFLDEYDKE